MRGPRGGFVKIVVSLAAALLAVPASAGPRRQQQLPRGVAPSLDRAETKLRRPLCSSLFQEFLDASGRPLSRQLQELGLEGHEFLEWLTWAPGGNFRRCLSPATLAFTGPGDRVVYVCESHFAVLQRTDPDGAAHILIHEALHALGLGENPPSSASITHAVTRACGE